MSDSPKLSIVMITVPERINDFKNLFAKVQKQIDYCHEVHPTLGAVEIVDVITAKYLHGGPTIGQKRQMGLDKAQGEYVCWLDDDDNVAPNYVETILRLAMNGADVLTFSSFARFDNFYCVVDMSLGVQQDDQVKPGIVYRRPYHVCAWRRELLKDIEFPDQNWDEDTGFIKIALEKCKTESKTSAILHEYNRTTKSIAWESVQ